MSDTILNLQEAADYLKVHRRTLYRMIKKRSIPHQRTSPQGPYRFHKAALDGWLGRSDDSSLNSLHQDPAICQVKNEVETVDSGDLAAKQEHQNP